MLFVYVDHLAISVYQPRLRTNEKVICGIENNIQDHNRTVLVRAQSLDRQRLCRAQVLRRDIRVNDLRLWIYPADVNGAVVHVVEVNLHTLGCFLTRIEVRQLVQGLKLLIKIDKLFMVDGVGLIIQLI